MPVILPVIHTIHLCQSSLPVIHASHPCPPSMIVHDSPLLSMIESSTLTHQSSDPPSHQTIPTKPNHTIPNLRLYLQVSITAISIHNATLLSCHFRKIATVSHFRLFCIDLCLFILLTIIIELGK